MKANRLFLLAVITAMIAAPLTTVATAQKTRTEYHPFHPSQVIDCNQVDNALPMIPQGNGDGTITADELGPGGWRYNRLGQSFITFALTLNETSTGYDVVAGRSNLGANTGIINDYPETFDLVLDPTSEVLTLSGREATVTLGSGDGTGFSFPGHGGTEINIVLHDTDGDGTYEGCAVSPLLSNFGVLVQEGGDFLQREYFKVTATVNEAGTVTYLEYTEISTFKQVKNK